MSRSIREDAIERSRPDVSSDGVSHAREVVRTVPVRTTSLHHLHRLEPSGLSEDQEVQGGLGFTQDGVLAADRDVVHLHRGFAAFEGDADGIPMAGFQIESLA